MTSVAIAPDTVDILPAAFWIHCGTPPTMGAPHRHDDVEINIVLSGQLDYIFGGTRLTVPAGQAAVFWAATPHRLLTATGDQARQTRGCWLHIPLRTVLSWALPEDRIGRLLGMSAMITSIECLPYDPDPLFAAWSVELSGHQPGNFSALLEIQALLRRVIDSSVHPTAVCPGPQDHRRHSSVLTAVTAMAQHIVGHFREQLTIEDIAAAVHLNRTYAATIFSRSLGTTPGRYLTRCRVTEAQRLLITTDRPMLDIAHASGFSSQSSFYDQFTRLCGCSPGAYRRRHG